MKAPALLGQRPMFPDGLPFARPSTPSLERVTARLRPSYEACVLTNGPLVRELEERAAQRLGVRFVRAVSSCTSGLLLTVRALDEPPAVILPSFTFSASAHAVAWNHCAPVFVDCNERTFQVDPDCVAERLGERTAILATHVFGAPCEVERLEQLARAHAAPLVFDAAHAFGALRKGRPVGGFGDAEVFSLSPTKPLVAGEGGLVATNREDIAESVRIGRDYGNPGDYDTRFVGLNARMSELHAAVALESLTELDEQLARRRALAARYSEGLDGLAGVCVQAVDPDDESTYKDFTITIGEAFGLSRDEVVAGLRAEGIDTRCYFSPPVHRQQAYLPASGSLPRTDRLAASVISLPMFGALSVEAVDGVVEVLRALTAKADEIRHVLAA